MIVHARRFLLLLGLAVAATLLTGCNSPDRLPPILYLRADDAGRIQLYRQDAVAATPRRLSGQAAGDVVDFAPSPDGRRVVYTVADGARGSLRSVNRDGDGDREVLACPDAECSGPVWSPDGARLVYERRLLAANGALGSPRLYWLDPTDGATLPLVAGEVIGYGARFSPDGAWLSYVSPGDAGVVLYHLADGRQRLLSSRVGRPAAFSPDSAQVIVSDLVLEGNPTAPDDGDTPAPIQESSRVFLYRVSLAEEGRERLSADLPVDDSAPAWSPDGQWVAFGRAPADAASGRQLWLMRPDGSEARSLTSDPNLFHGPPTWSPDGTTLLYQRFDLSDPAATPEVWHLRLADSLPTLIAPGGYLPAWLLTD
ncbi:MAG: PD40 domain-containing protein [Candidatus Promineofilum sp.]|nr:PD40 domain-containing protein [Promineifilum sp.]